MKIDRLFPTGTSSSSRHWPLSCGFFFDRNNYLDSRELDRKIREMENEKVFYQHKIREDSAVISGLRDSAFLERFGRENFWMHRPDEVIYLIDEK